MAVRGWLRARRTCARQVQASVGQFLGGGKFDSPPRRLGRTVTGRRAGLKLQQPSNRLTLRKRKRPALSGAIKDGVRVVAQRGEDGRVDVRWRDGMRLGIGADAVGFAENLAA